MRKIFYIALGIALLATSFVSCHRKPEMKKVRAKVTNVTIHSDTLIDMTVQMGEDSMAFDLSDVKINDGIMVVGDSVIVDYIDGRGDKARALVVTTLPGKGRTIDITHPDESAPLKTTTPDKVNKKLEY